MKRGLEVVLAIFQFLGGLLTEIVERKVLFFLNRGRFFFAKTILLQLEVLHRTPWWAKTLISLLGIIGLGWFYF